VRRLIDSQSAALLAVAGTNYGKLNGGADLHILSPEPEEAALSGRADGGGSAALTGLGTLPLICGS